MNLHEYLDDEQQVNDDGFKVDNEKKASWALRKINQLQKEIEANNEMADEEIHKVEQWRTKQNKQAIDSIEHLTSLLNGYAITQKEQDPKFTSSSTPNGRYGFRKQQPEWIYDEETLLEHLDKEGKKELIRVKREVNKSEVKKKYEVTGENVVDPSTGEIVKGIKINHREDNFYVRVEG